MSWLARLRAWLAGGESPARSRGRARPARRNVGGRAGREVVDADLVAFLATRRGVEAFLEPPTAMHGRSVLLVAADGEFLRRSVPDRRAFERACHQRGVPVYDASRVGYPRRLREPGREPGPTAVELSDLPPWPGEGPEPGRQGPAEGEDGPPPPPPPVGR